MKNNYYKLLFDVQNKFNIHYNNFSIYGMFYIAENEDEYFSLPDGHSLLYPVFYNKKLKKITTESFLNAEFEKTLLSSKEDINVNIEYKEKKSNVLLIYNTLEFVYGHSLNRIQKLKGILDCYLDNDIYVIVAKNLEHLVPSCFGKIIIETRLEETYKIKNLLPLIENLKNKKKYQTLDFIFTSMEYNCYERDRKFFIDSWNIKEVNNKKRVVLYYRSNTAPINGRSLNRGWGVFQVYRYKYLIKSINNFFGDEFEIYIIGDKDSNNFKNVIDLRIYSFNLDVEKKYMSLLKNSFCVIGLTGSHMQIPIMLSQTSIEIVVSKISIFGGSDVAFLYDNVSKNFMFRKFEYFSGIQKLISHINVFRQFIIIVLAYDELEISQSTKNFNSFNMLKRRDVDMVNIGYYKFKIFLKKYAILFNLLKKIKQKIRL